MKKIILISVFSMSISSIGYCGFFDWFESTENKLKTTSEKLNKELPMEIDDLSVLYSTSAYENTFTYNYKIHPNTFSIIQMSKIEWRKVQLQWATNIYCTDPNSKLFRDNNVTIKYSYRYSNGIFLDEIVVNKSDCVN